jgi:cobalamin biosynthesis Mg chelatase CobN
VQHHQPDTRDILETKKAYTTQWSHGSFAAFCRKFGNHSTRVVGTHNWNEEAIESMVSDLSPKWRELCRQLERQGENAIEVVDNVLNETVDILGNLFSHSILQAQC